MWMKLDELLNYVANVVKQVVPSYSDLVKSLTLFKSVEEAERAPIDVVIRNSNTFREYNIMVLEKDYRYYPIIKPGTVLITLRVGFLKFMLKEHKYLLDIHTHPEPSYVPSSMT